MFSVAPETTANAPVRTETPRFSGPEERSSQQNGFAALIDVDAGGSNANPRAPSPDRRDTEAQTERPARAEREDQRAPSGTERYEVSNSPNSSANLPASNKPLSAADDAKAAKPSKPPANLSARDGGTESSPSSQVDGSLANAAAATLAIAPDPTAVAIPPIVAPIAPPTSAATDTGSTTPLTIAAAGIAASAQAAAALPVATGDTASPMAEAVAAATNDLVATNFTIAKTIATTPDAAMNAPIAVASAPTETADAAVQLESNPLLGSAIATANLATSAIKGTATVPRIDTAVPTAEAVSDEAVTSSSTQTPQPAASPPAIPTPHTSATATAAAATNAEDALSNPASAAAASANGHHATSPSRHSETLLQVDPGSQAANLGAMQQLQPQAPTTAPIPASQLTATAATNLTVPLNGLAVQIATSAQGGKSRFEIRLDPAELGRIDVRLDVDRHGQVTSHLTVEKPETLAMLRQDAPQLQRALEDAGLKTSTTGLQFSLRDQSSSGNHNGDGAERQPQRLIISDANPAPTIAAGRTYAHAAGASRGVDIRV